eukprot:7384407-Prymnesium_polylepis.1
MKQRQAERMAEAIGADSLAQPQLLVPPPPNPAPSAANEGGPHFPAAEPTKSPLRNRAESPQTAPEPPLSQVIFAAHKSGVSVDTTADAVRSREVWLCRGTPHVSSEEEECSGFSEEEEESSGEEEGCG